MPRMLLKGCPTCGGDLFPEHEVWGTPQGIVDSGGVDTYPTVLKCLQCSRVAGKAKKQGRPEWMNPDNEPWRKTRWE